MRRFAARSTCRFDNKSHTVTIDGLGQQRPWYNYLWSHDGYVCGVSNVGMGVSRYLPVDGSMSRLNEENAKCFYLRDDESGICWCPTYSPMNEAPDEYRCDHGLSHTRFACETNQIESSLTVTVPMGGTHELWRLELKNASERPRRLSLFAAVKFELEGGVELRLAIRAGLLGQAQ